MNKIAPSASELCNIKWRPYGISVVSRAEYTWLKHQMKVNFILNRIVIENLCNWMNSFEVIWKELYCGRHLGIVAAILEWPNPYALYANYEKFCLNRKVPVSLHDWSNGFGVILKKFYLAAILENGGVQDIAYLANFHQKHYFSRNVYVFNDIWHIFS